VAVEKQTVPTDPIIEMPHPLLVYDVEPDEPWNYDHMFFPRRSPLLQDLGGVAVRRCYGQHIPIRIHMLKNRCFDAVDLPQNEDEQFRTVVKGFAGVVSRWAIDMRLALRGKEDPLVYMDDEVFRQTTNRFSMYHQHARRAVGDRYVRREVGRFMVDYALRSNLRDLVSDRVVGEFLGTRNPLRRTELGNHIINQALRARLDPIAPEVTELRRLGLVQEGRPGIWELPGKLIRRTEKREYHDLLAMRLA
jgi:hypothetical protein